MRLDESFFAMEELNGGMYRHVTSYEKYIQRTHTPTSLRSTSSAYFWRWPDCVGSRQGILIFFCLLS